MLADELDKLQTTCMKHGTKSFWYLWMKYSADAGSLT